MLEKIKKIKIWDGKNKSILEAEIIHPIATANDYLCIQVKKCKIRK